MLVLSRQRDETIMIGDDVEITVVDVRGDKVRLGITAPSRIAVHRKEVYEAIRKENMQASAVGAADLAGMEIQTRRAHAPASAAPTLRAGAIGGGSTSPGARRRRA